MKPIILESIAYIDLDGIVIDASRREMYANDIVDNETSEIKHYLGNQTLEKVKKEIFFHRSVFLNEDELYMDTYIPGTIEHLEALEHEGYSIIFLTSRPEYMRKDTIDWLEEHGIRMDHRQLVCKPPAAQFVKTTTWKASMIDSLTMLFHGRQVIVIDDSQENLDEVVKHLDTSRFFVSVYTSFKDAEKDVIK